jgi:N-acetylglucosamine-6-phosphate deacetylase
VWRKLRGIEYDNALAMPPIVLHASRALTPLEEISDAAVVIEDGLITRVGRRNAVRVPPRARVINAMDKTVVPGFVDVHIHGAGGHDVMEANPAALSAIAATVARHGTTSFVATTVTASTDTICQSAEGIGRYIEKQGTPAGKVCAAEILGIHFEGPFLSATRRGVHPVEWLALPSAETLETFLASANGTARILTLAPELLGAMPCIDAARKAALVVSLGHSDATYNQAIAAIRRGAQHAAHVFNAMRPFSHRETGILGAVLTEQKVTAELIADGVHVDEAAMRLLWGAKGFKSVILVSDGTAATGMPDGKYSLGTFEVEVVGGVCRNSEGRLAGSTLTLDRALRNVVEMGVTLLEAVGMLTINPARLLALEGKKGVLRAGADADLVLLDPKLHLAGVMTRGIGL